MTIRSTDPRDPKRDILRHRTDGIATGTMVAIAAALVASLGVVWYAMLDHRPNTASTTPPAIDRSAPPVTSGQGGTMMNPGPAENAPNPTPPAAPATPPASR
jgi:hypothetical protein